MQSLLREGGPISYQPRPSVTFPPRPSPSKLEKEEIAYGLQVVGSEGKRGLRGTPIMALHT